LFGAVRETSGADVLHSAQNRACRWPRETL